MLRTQVCLEHCSALGATFMATQYGFECWCSDEIDLDYDRHQASAGKDAECDMMCQGNTVRSPLRVAVSLRSRSTITVRHVARTDISVFFELQPNLSV